MIIKIEFYKDDYMMELFGQDIAHSVLDAEGKLAMMSRHYQKSIDNEKALIKEDEQV